MKKFLFLLFCLLGTTVCAQNLWQQAAISETNRLSAKPAAMFTLNASALQARLKNAQLSSRNAEATIIDLPLVNGSVEKFSVYSRPVADSELAQKYDLQSYVGVGIDDPEKFARFSFSNGVLNAMVIKGDTYNFIDPKSRGENIYKVTEKTSKNGKAFICKTSETLLSRSQLDALYARNPNPFSANSAVAARISAQKFHTFRLALSVTGEYTQYFGGTVSGALTAMNATMTRVNGILERDLSVHLNMINKPEIIYTDPRTDPYSDAATGVKGDWSLELQKTLTAVVGEANYDIGHLFGASGGGGNAGCVGCVCTSPATDSAGIPTAYGKGSAFTSPGDSIPEGNNFDIDYVTHEIGHQLGANHTFSYELENGTNANLEPGSGSTIMGYAGITGTNTDVQAHTDAYFHFFSIQQIQSVLNSKSCGTTTPIANTPPTIDALPSYTIPKSTAFVLTASAKDAEGDALNYTWEENDLALVPINKTNLGTTSSGPSFRSVVGTAVSSRYFPAFSTVMNGKVADVNTWEATSSVARTTNFSVTVRDNNPGGSQNATANEAITVGNDGTFAFNIIGTTLYTNQPQNIAWIVANTNAAPYNSPNVKLDCTADNGSTWTTLLDQTANDGSENVTIPTNFVGKSLKFRLSSIGNVFYAVSPAYTIAAAPQDCTGAAPGNITFTNITTSTALVGWDLQNGASYIVQYRPYGQSSWISATVSTNYTTLQNLAHDTKYEVQIATVCSGSTGAFSSILNFITPSALAYCKISAPSSSEEFISNVTVGTQSLSSGADGYSDYTTDPAKQILLPKGSSGNTVSVTKSWAKNQYSEAVAVWIDFNRNGIFEASERILTGAADTTTPVSATFDVPSTVAVGSSTRMRVMLKYNAAIANGDACATIADGEVENYRVTFTGADMPTVSGAVALYPNPVDDILHISNIAAGTVYAIYDLSGRLVASGNISLNKIDVSELLPAVYLITMSNSSQKITAKFIKH